MEIVRTIYRDVATGLERRRRRRLVIRAVDLPCQVPTVYFLTPDFDRPAGGIRVIYRHVDILNRAGISAAILHFSRNFRATWFEHDTRISDLATATLKLGDLLVLSELDVDLIGSMPIRIPHIIFNQNFHLTWSRKGANNEYYAANPGLLGVVTVSSHSEDALRYAFPALSVHRIHLGIDPIMFRFGDAPRDRRIAFMPRRGSDDARTVLSILRARGELQGWEVQPLDGLKENQIGERLRKCRIFLSLSHQEGFGLPPAEAMACGAFTIGYDGFGGREFFRPEFSRSVAPGDILGFARAVSETLLQERADDAWCRLRGKRASRFILNEYSQQREAEEVIALYRRSLTCLSEYADRSRKMF